MRKSSGIGSLFTMVSLVVLFLHVVACSEMKSDVFSVSDRRDAPLIKGTDLVTGDVVSLNQFEGTIVVVNFWASWCMPCKSELPVLQEFSNQHPEIQVLGVNFQDLEDEARKLQAEIGFSFPSVSDPRGDFGADYSVRGMPITFFLDSRHRIVGKIVGEADIEQFEQGLKLAIQG
tara:strand:- start:463 stop:987 length:525 start_codon:yes stop_codon:yes gene_type:complete